MTDSPAYLAAVEALRTVDAYPEPTTLGSSADRHRPRLTATATAARVRTPEPCDVDRLATRSAATMRGDGIGPVVIVGWRWAQLPPKGWQDGHVWGLGRWWWQPEDQPSGPPLYGGAQRLNLAGRDGWRPSYGSRALTLAVLGTPKDAAATERGTRALVAAVTACEIAATQLTAADERGDVSGRTARAYRAESAALTDHAAACEARLEGSLAWWGDYAATLPPEPPLTPVVAAQLRGYVTASPI